jgi:hypothetical protein
MTHRIEAQDTESFVSEAVLESPKVRVTLYFKNLNFKAIKLRDAFEALSDDDRKYFSACPYILIAYRL